MPSFPSAEDSSTVISFPRKDDVVSLSNDQFSISFRDSSPHPMIYVAAVTGMEHPKSLPSIVQSALLNCQSWASADSRCQDWLWDSGANVSIVAAHSIPDECDDITWGETEELTIRGFGSTRKYQGTRGKTRGGIPLLKIDANVRRIASATNLARAYPQISQELVYDEVTDKCFVYARFNGSRWCILAESAPGKPTLYLTSTGQNIVLNGFDHSAAHRNRGRPLDGHRVNIISVADSGEDDVPEVYAVGFQRKGSPTNIASSEAVGMEAIRTLILKVGGSPSRLKKLLEHANPEALKRINLDRSFLTCVNEHFPDSSKMIATLHRQQQQMATPVLECTRCNHVYLLDEIHISSDDCTYANLPAKNAILLIDVWSGMQFLEFYDSPSSVPRIVAAFIKRRNAELDARMNGSERGNHHCAEVRYDTATVHCSGEMQRLLGDLGCTGVDQAKGSHTFLSYLDSICRQLRSQAGHLISAQMLPRKVIAYAYVRCIETNNMILPYRNGQTGTVMTPYECEFGLTTRIDDLPFLFGSPALVRLHDRKAGGASWAQYLGSAPRGGSSYFLLCGPKSRNIVMRRVSLILERKMTLDIFHCMLHGFHIDFDNLSQQSLSRALTQRRHGVRTYVDHNESADEWRQYQLAVRRGLIVFRCRCRSKQSNKRYCNVQYNSLHRLREHWKYGTSCVPDTSAPQQSDIVAFDDDTEDLRIGTSDFFGEFTGHLTTHDLTSGQLFRRLSIVTEQSPDDYAIPLTLQASDFQLLTSKISNGLKKWAEAPRVSKKVVPTLIPDETLTCRESYRLLALCLKDGVQNTSRRAKVRLIRTGLRLRLNHGNASDLTNYLADILDRPELLSTSSTSHGQQDASASSDDAPAPRRSARIRERQKREINQIFEILEDWTELDGSTAEVLPSLHSFDVYPTQLLRDTLKQEEVSLFGTECSTVCSEPSATNEHLHDYLDSIGDSASVLFAEGSSASSAITQYDINATDLLQDLSTLGNFTTAEQLISKGEYILLPSDYKPLSDSELQALIKKAQSDVTTDTQAHFLPMRIGDVSRILRMSKYKKLLKQAIVEEINSIRNRADFTIRRRRAGEKTIGSRLILSFKFKNGKLARAKCRLVADGSSEVAGHTFYRHELANEVMSAADMRMLLALAMRGNHDKGLAVATFDIKNAYLVADTAGQRHEYALRLPQGTDVFLAGGDLPPETTYQDLDEARMRHFSPLRRGESKKDFVAQLVGNLYGLRRAARVFDDELRNRLKKIGFHPLKNVRHIYVRHRQDDDGNPLPSDVLGTYVDDILLIASDEAQLELIHSHLRKYFEASDYSYNVLRADSPIELLGVKLDLNCKSPDNHFIEISGVDKATRIITDVEREVGEVECKRTPLPKGMNLSLSKAYTPDEESRIAQALNFSDYPQLVKFMRRTVGSLLFIGITSHLCIAHAVGMLARRVISPDETVLSCLKHLCGFLKQCKGMTVRVGNKNAWASDTFLTGLSDASFCDDTHRKSSTGGYLINILGTTVVNRSFRINAVCLSSTESEIYALSVCAQHLERFRRLLTELAAVRQSWLIDVKISAIPYLGSSKISREKLHSDRFRGQLAFLVSDSQPALQAALKDTESSRIRHIAIHRSFLVELTRTLELVGLVHVTTGLNAADMNTKPLSGDLVARHSKIILGHDAHL